MDQNTHAALDFLQMVIDGKIDDAFAKYVDPSGKHHNAYTPAGFTALKKGMMENHEKFPHKRFSVKHVVSQGDFVAVHSNVTLDSKADLAVVHLFQFHNGKIVQMWDVGQLIPTDSPNADGPF